MANEHIRNPLGATNRYPRGKVNQCDEGELKIAVYSKDGTIFVNFGKAIAWIGLDSDSAKNLAEILLKYTEAI